uniref:Leucine rich repeat protein 1 n=1 Tax=Zosterops lateralis melanops TaxID=1220523 RepID=A0A8D2QVR8_ZOSLA
MSPHSPVSPHTLHVPSSSMSPHTPCVPSQSRVPPLTLCVPSHSIPLCPQVQQNVERLFTRFVEEGKATVRLREPAVDLCLSKVGTWLSQHTEQSTGTISPYFKYHCIYPHTKVIYTKKKSHMITKFSCPPLLCLLQESFVAP